MKKSEYIREQVEPLFDFIRPFLNPEDDPDRLRQKLELWALRFLANAESVCTNAEDKPDKFPED